MYGLRIWTQDYDFRAYDLITIITHHARGFFVLLFCFVFFFPVEMGNPEDEGKCPQNGHGMYLNKLSINSFFSPPYFYCGKIYLTNNLPF